MEYRDTSNIKELQSYPFRITPTEKENVLFVETPVNIIFSINTIKVVLEMNTNTEFVFL